MSELVSESYRILTDTYGDVIPSEKNCNILFKWFESGNFDFEIEEQTEPSEMVQEEDEEQAGTSEKINDIEMRKSSSEEIVKTEYSNFLKPELMTSNKKMFLREILLHYYNMKKSSGLLGENCGSVKYLTKFFANRVEQICQFFIKEFKRGTFVFEDDLLKKIEELEVMEREKKQTITQNVIIQRKKDEKRNPYVPSPEKLFFQRVLLHCFNMNTKCSESYNILQEFYSKQDGNPSARTCYRMFKQFERGNLAWKMKSICRWGDRKNLKMWI